MRKRPPLRAQTLRQSILTRLLLGVGAQLLLLVLVALGMATAAGDNGKLAALSVERQDLGALEETMLEQRTWLQDYLASGAPEFLTEYQGERKDTGEAIGTLTDHMEGTPDAPRVASIVADARTWENWAEGLVQKGPAAGPQVRSPA